MIQIRHLRRIAICGLCAVPTPAFAHSFGTPYILPVPFWMYVYGCTATLIGTFAVLGYFASRPSMSATPSTSSTSLRIAKPVVSLLRIGAFAMLALTIAAGFIGNNDPGENISMSLFWVMFLLGFAYITFVIGDLYAHINPWASILDWIERLGVNLTTPRVAYPRWLGAWPAFVFYLALIWTELFGAQSARGLSTLLSAYSLATVCGAALFGKDAWFTRADFFAIYFRLIGTMAPVEYGGDANGALHVRFRWPFTATAAARPDHISLVLFVLFMLSSTAYDGIYETQLWTALFWRNLLAILQPLWGSDLGAAQALLMDWFLIYRQAGLVVFPFLYFAVYLLALLGAKLLARIDAPLRELGFAFAYSLIPIAFAYNFTHYYTFLLSQVYVMPWLIADPFGFGWNLLGLAPSVTDFTLQMGAIWHTQVVVILIGHVAGVMVAHRVAIRVFASQRDVIVSQLPLLALMVVYTIIGLWILTLPLG